MVPFVCGILVDRMSVYLGRISISWPLNLAISFICSVIICEGYEADAVAFYAGAVFAVMVIPLIMQLDLHVERNEKSVVSTVKEISGMMDFNVFLLVSLVIGIVFGFHVAYRPVFATELQASKTLIGETTQTNSPEIVILRHLLAVLGHSKWIDSLEVLQSSPKDSPGFCGLF